MASRLLRLSRPIMVKVMILALDPQADLPAVQGLWVRAADDTILETGAPDSETGNAMKMNQGE